MLLTQLIDQPFGLTNSTKLLKRQKENNRAAAKSP
jgi:hypothetical protein